jgi:hypothetical protein
VANSTLQRRAVTDRATTEARQASQKIEQSPWLERLARVGYGIVAVLAIMVAVGVGGETTSREGALAAVAREPFGKLLLLVLAVGFAGYAAWRLVQAVLDRDDEGSDAKGLAKRASYLGRAVIYVGLTVATVRLLTGSGQSQGGSGQQKQATATVLDWPAGRWLVGAAALAIIGYAGYQLYRGVARKFLDGLETGEMGPTERRSIERLGVVGLVARGVVFALVGVFLAKAAWEYDPQEAIGLDGALRKLADAAYGPWLLGVTAAGLLAYGLFCVAQARYRRV